MTICEWFFLFLAVFGIICGYVGLNSKEKTEAENDRLWEKLLIEKRKADYYKQIAGIVDGRHREFFDFEKVNSKEEK